MVTLARHRPELIRLKMHLQRTRRDETKVVAPE
jgi:hypothetical protein